MSKSLWWLYAPVESLVLELGHVDGQGHGETLSLVAHVGLEEGLLLGTWDAVLVQQLGRILAQGPEGEKMRSSGHAREQEGGLRYMANRCAYLRMVTISVRSVSVKRLTKERQLSLRVLVVASPKAHSRPC